jgi:mRNA interferase RelE/StbE
VNYIVQAKASLKKDVKKIPADILQEIYRIIALLAENPRREGVRKITGSDNLYRIRVGDYRVIFEMDDKEKLVLIVYVRHRKDACRGL